MEIKNEFNPKVYSSIHPTYTKKLAELYATTLLREKRENPTFSHLIHNKKPDNTARFSNI
jgi:hypothetical protein